MSVRTTVIGTAVSVVGGGFQTLYTVAVNETVIIKEVLLYNLDGVAHNGQVYASNIVETRLGSIVNVSLTPNTPVRTSGFTVLLPGHNLRFYSDGVSVYVWVSGTRLVGVA